MKWRASLAWYDGQVGVPGVFESEVDARRAAESARNQWRLGIAYAEWGYDDCANAEPVIRLYRIEASAGMPEEAPGGDRDAPIQNTPPR